MSKKSVNDIDSRPYFVIQKQAADGSDNTVLYTSGDVSWANLHIIEGVANNVDVFVSTDGSTFTTNPIFLEDMYTATPATRVTTVAANKIGVLRGVYKKVKVQNAGAAQGTARIVHTVE